MQGPPAGATPAHPPRAASTRAQLFLSQLAATLVPLLALAVFLATSLPRRYTEEAVSHLRIELQLARPLVAARLPAGPAALEQLARELSRQTGLRMTIIERS